MSAHRYWRVYISANNGGVYATIAELEMYGPDFLTNECHGGTPFASDFANSDNAPAYAFNGSSGDKWTCSFGFYGYGWIAYDFASPVDISSIAIVANYAGGGQESFCPRDFAVEYSDNGTYWTVKKTFTDEMLWGATEQRRFLLADAWPIYYAHEFGIASVATGGFGPVVVSTPDQIAHSRDLELGGTGEISGTVKKQHTPDNIPLHRRVRLVRERDGIVAKETWSDPITGAYSFSNIDTRTKFSIVAYDYEHEYRAEISDNILAVVTP